jgi:hypothetical protein
MKYNYAMEHWLWDRDWYVYSTQLRNQQNVVISWTVRIRKEAAEFTFSGDYLTDALQDAVGQVAKLEALDDIIGKISGQVSGD